MKLNTKYWLKFSIINLLIVGILGVLMRYKIGFEFPYFNQKYIQHAHSHFAFVGWISHTLYVLIINFIQNKIPLTNHKSYKLLLILNLICAYGMLISFAIQGYGVISIALSTVTIFIACFYAFYVFKDFNKLEIENPSLAWFKAALIFNVMSSIGTFYLAYMMGSRKFDENWYLASVYFYLHFQYNGFFIFTCMGLAIDKIKKVIPAYTHDKNIFTLFYISFIPAYFLSTLWANIPIWLYIIVVIAAFIQVIAWVKFINKIRISLSSKNNLNKIMQYLFLFIALAFTIKLLLQLGSTIPALSKLAFGFRPVVIAYLHLVLLAVISVFLLTYMYTFKLIKESKLTLLALVIFVIGVLLNEVVLGIQGLASFSYFVIPKINETLFVVSIIILLSLILLVASQLRKSTNNELNSENI